MANSDRKMNVTVPIEYEQRGEKKTFWHTIGTAFENDKGQITIYMNSLPLPGPDGRVKVMLFDKKDDADRDHVQDRKKGGSSSRKPRTTGGGSSDIDDEIPF